MYSTHNLKIHLTSSLFAGLLSQQQVRPEDDSSSQTLSQITIINADGIYLATFTALLLNLKLIRIGYYKDDTKQPPVTEVN
jgi:brefeldin A-inhibited guanine nucleotide-exchange protein 3